MTKLTTSEIEALLNSYIAIYNNLKGIKVKSYSITGRQLVIDHEVCVSKRADGKWSAKHKPPYNAAKQCVAITPYLAVAKVLLKHYKRESLKELGLSQRKLKKYLRYYSFISVDERSKADRLLAKNKSLINFFSDYNNLLGNS